LNQEPRNRGNGIAEIEAKAAMVAAMERGAATEFQNRKKIRGFHVMVSSLPDLNLIPAFLFPYEQLRLLRFAFA
jgi:hypothetical protein